MATVRRARANGPPAPVPPPRAPLTAPPCRLAVDKNFDDCSLADFSSALLGYQSFAQTAKPATVSVGLRDMGMPDLVSIKRALLSVSDKSDLVPFAKALVKQGVEILSTGGTAT